MVIPSPTEMIAVAFTVICIFLAGRNNIHTWWTGIVACVAYGFVFYDVKLYADMTLQLFFIGTAIVGWYSWRDNKAKPVLAISRIRDGGHLDMYIVFPVFVWVGYTAVLVEFTDAVAPAWDTAILVLSVIGQLLLMRRKLETWYFWIAVNTIAVPLFWSRELYLSSVLYAVFWIHAFYAAYRWNKEYTNA
jgi:nicotinamide mononucleotide transporter